MEKNKDNEDKTHNNSYATTGTSVATPTSPHLDPIATTPTATTKEKRSWFSSLTRRKKSQSQTSLATPVASVAPSEPLFQNNNNTVSRAGATVNADELAIASTSRKRKDEKNILQRIRKKMGLRFNSLRHRKHDSDDDVAGASGTTDASAEFLTHSPIREPQLTFSFANTSKVEEEEEIIPFTEDYKRFIAKKWLERESEPNHVMYKACSEMLNQVWYWGGISRFDAQKQLTDKPTGSFLVRDSESNGCQFTLSFRMVNRTLHYRLEYRDNNWHFEELKYSSIVDMIENILYRCTYEGFVCFVKVPNEVQPPFPVILKYPLSRYLKMPLLQDLCRRVIQRQHSTLEQIVKLPIPPKLHEYLSEKRELVFQS